LVGLLEVAVGFYEEFLGQFNESRKIDLGMERESSSPPAIIF
jgi:hypothetical protein